MAEDGDSANKQQVSSHHRPSSHQETFQSAPEAQVEHRYPARSTGIISLPPGSRGPRSLYLRRNGDSFGFTLRHFIVYPPDSLQDALGTRQAAIGALLAPMDTIFVKNVAPYSPAEQAGLQYGDRIVAVNGVSVTDKTYAQVVHLIQYSPEYLHLLVVPKEEDVLQKFFGDTAHNPVSNQQFLLQQRPHQSSKSTEFQADAVSWRSLQEAAYGGGGVGIVDSRPYKQQRQQRSADNLLYANPAEVPYYNRPEEVIDESRRKSRAQPQVPLYRKMGRRASEGSTFSNKDLYQHEFIDNPSAVTPTTTTTTSGSAEMVVSGPKMKNSSAKVMCSHSSRGVAGDHLHTFNYPNAAGCRLSLDGGGRRESASSLTSSIADGSKDSLSSYDSASTLTGQETDDSVIMTRLRKNLQKKEEFLRRPSHPVEASPTIQREYYSRSKKFDKPNWPPNESPSRTIKPVHQNFQRVKSDIDTERDLGIQIQGQGQADGGGFITGGAVTNLPQQKGANSPKDWYYAPSLNPTTRMREASPAPASLDNPGQMNGATSIQDEDRRLYLTNLQMVSKRTKQFESGRPMPEDDPMLKDRTSFYRSELARLSSKRVVPHVTIRAHEFESRSSEPRRDPSGSSTSSSALRRQHRDSRSLESSDMLQDVDNQPIRMRARSNSADSWAAVIQISRKDEKNQKTFAGQVAANDERPRDHQQQRQQQEEEIVNSVPAKPMSPLIPEPVEHLQTNPIVAITPASPSPIKSPPVRPNQLDLGSPVRPARRNHSLRSGDSSPRRSSSPANSEEHRPVVIRRTKNANLADEDRVVRRESYLKATGNGRMHVDDFSDGEVSPQTTRSAHRKWRPPLFPGDIQQLRKLFEDAAYSLGGSVSGGSSSSVSLEREKTPSSSTPSEKEKQIIKEGLLHCKIAEIDGKRAADRSWKQVWTVLKGSKLYLFKDRSHQSPADTAEQSLVNGVDVSTSCVRIAEDYTKRKHVLRVSSIHPCRSELLLQADNPVDLAEWVKALQEQVASASDIDSKSDVLTASQQQQAVPQSTPASTTIQVQGSGRLSPQPSKSKLPSALRSSRPPADQSPVSKSRKPSQVSNEGLASPKSKTWRGRVAKQFRKIQGASSPSSPTAPEGSTFGVPLEQCYPSNNHQLVPRLVEVCTDIVESKGLDTIGVYRVPGNSAAITALTNSVNQSYEGVPQLDAQWNDVHVVGSLLKSFFRKLPDALLTSGLYSNFIEADKIENPKLRMEEIRRLVRCLPPHHYHTLKHLMLHLKKVTNNSEVNKMEGRNLAIVFGPTVIRNVQDDMATMVNDMTHNYKIVESLICYADWFFSEDDGVCLNLPPPAAPVDSLNNELDVASNRALLLDNISKIEAGLKGEKVPGPGKELLSSIISAAQRKIRKGTKAATSQEAKEELGTQNGVKDHPGFSGDLKQNMAEEKPSNIPTTIGDIEKSSKQLDRGGTWFNYSDQDNFRRRIENFIQETHANLQRNRKTAEFYSDNTEPRVPGAFHNINQENALASLPKTNFTSDPYVITKTQSASNVFYRPLNGNTATNTSSSALTVQYTPKNSSDFTDNKTSAQYNKNSSDPYGNFDLNRNKERHETGNSGGFQSTLKSRFSDMSDGHGAVVGSKPIDRILMRRGSSVENVNTSIMDLSSNGAMKKIKYGNENNDVSQRTGSLDSLHKLHDPDDGGDLQSSIMKIFDEKKRTLNPLSGADLPFADESPERPAFDNTAYQNKENIPASPKLYRNPSLHKSLFSSGPSKFTRTPNNLEDFKSKETQKSKVEEDKDRDCSENVPDNERHISNTEKLALNNSNVNNKPNTNVNFSFGSSNSKLRRSESLNKPERTVSPLNNKLKRSESLNKASDRLKRSDSLTKNEKTENNINKRRELSAASRRTNKEFTKLKRKSGMPERSIKRRHTVGGTKDFDKVNWLDNRYQEENSSAEKNNKEKSTLRTSSPDLSSTRRERLFFEVNLVGPENMVVALRQHLIGARPQSLPEPRIFTVPLESHV